MIRLALPLIALAAIGCTAAARPGTAPPAPARKCSDAALASLIGKTRSETVAAEALRRSGAKTLRWIRPGMMVTMDYREDRLNLHVDVQGKILSARCG